MKPVLQALVVAEHVYTDVTGKKIIAGTFNGIEFKRNANPVKEQELPDGTKVNVLQGGEFGGSPYAYISITDVVDGTELSLQFVNLTRNKIIFGTDFKLECPDRLATIEIVAPLPFLPIGEAGAYALELVWKGEVLGSHRIIAKETSS